MSESISTQVESPLTRYKDKIQTAVYAALQEPDPTDGLMAMAKYHFGLVDTEGNQVDHPRFPGKAIRPMLALLTYEALGGNADEILPVATAFELIHNFSLIHDDIQDGDAMRHGRPTVWKIFGEKQAINAGTIVLLKAMRQVHMLVEQGFDPKRVQDVAQAMGEITERIIEGQFLDIQLETRAEGVTVDDYLTMIDGKTGTMIAAPLVIAAFLHSEDAITIEQFYELGFSLGRIFQIQDDYLGIWGETEKTGKPVGADIARRKKSYPVMYALEHATGIARDQLLAYYTKTTQPTEEEVQAVLEILERVGARQATKDAVEQFSQAAEAAIEVLPVSNCYKDDFREINAFLTQRES